MREDDDGVSIRHLLSKSHPDSDHLIHIGLGSSEMLVEIGLEVLDYATVFTGKLGHLLQRVREVLVEKKVLHMINTDSALSLETLGETDVSLLHSLVHQPY
jgi:hypothetical protein